MDKYLKRKREDGTKTKQEPKKQRTGSEQDEAEQQEEQQKDEKSNVSNVEDVAAADASTSTAAAESSVAFQVPSHNDVSKLEDFLHPSWRTILKDELAKPYFAKLKTFLAGEIKAHPDKIFPPLPHVFEAFNHSTFDKVKVVILGQDPYHGKGQAHGLCFSVNKGVQVPPSLKNMYKELATDIPGFRTPKHGYLLEWADQGVFLLNTVMTVREKEPNSHQKQGWETFTDAVISKLSKQLDGVVFILWGAPSQKKMNLIDSSKHCILKAAHPSPLSASKGFFGCKHFSQCNAYLQKKGKTPINWKISD